MRRRSAGSSASARRSRLATLVHLLSIGRKRPSGRRSANSTTFPSNATLTSSRSGGSWPRARASTLSPPRPRLDDPATTASSRRRLSAAWSIWRPRLCSIAFTSARARRASPRSPRMPWVAWARSRREDSRPSWTSRRTTSWARPSLGDLREQVFEPAGDVAWRRLGVRSDPRPQRGEEPPDDQAGEHGEKDAGHRRYRGTPSGRRRSCPAAMLQSGQFVRRDGPLGARHDVN